MLIFPNTHEAIIDEETWKLANEIKKKKGRHRKLANGTYSHKLSGFVYCADCGNKLSFHSEHSQHRPDGKTYDADNYFKCSKAGSRYDDKCTAHYVKASTLEKLILMAIQMVSDFALDNEEEFIAQIDAGRDTDREQEIKNDKKRLTACKHRMSELDLLIKRLYEQNTLGKISDRQYDKLMAGYDKEQSDLDKEIAGIEYRLNSSDYEGVRTDKFLAVVKRYTDFTELTTQMVHEFIDRVEVHQPIKEKGKPRTQEIDIYFNFIGKIDLSCSYHNKGQRSDILVPEVALFEEKKAI